ncbi:MAG: Cytochrome c-type biogenesis protein CcmC, putative heme lyase for CcmE [Ignavibacteriae bacterium]|nr:MAG: Cytochrome c-type biogenesis protein CcmC, putative heme lyase for CcmE [Ignavibacteriota bacterium]
MVYKIILGIGLTITIIAGLSFPMVEIPRFWYEMPIVPGLEDKARIIFFHVPTAWVSVIAFISSLYFGIKYLRNSEYTNDIKSVTAASLGFLFCILATITGAIWAKFSWGTYWNWDPRQTSIFILLLIYGAYFALRSSIENEEKKATLSAVYSIIAGLTVPFFIFIMPRIVASLHPDPIINPQAKIHMNPTMLIIFLLSLIGFTGIYIWMFTLKVKFSILNYSKKMKEQE